MFSAADAYETFMGRWSRRIAPLFVRFAGVQDGDRILDVGSGTGALTDAILAAASSSSIVGLDRSEPYVHASRRRHQGQRIQFNVGDAQQLPFGNASFDRTLSLLILNFIPDPDKAVREMMRVTRGGGTVAAAVWDYGDDMEMLRLFWDAAIALAPAAERNDERHMPFCRPGELQALWRAHGLLDVSETPLAIETSFSSFDDYWTPFLKAQGPAGAYVASLSEHDVDRLRLKLRRSLAAEPEDGGITLRARAWAVKGIRKTP